MKTVPVKSPDSFSGSTPAPQPVRNTAAALAYVKDHVVPLCKNGPDTVDNLQWQTTADGKAKDKWECKK
jgi:hypothetical protein